MDKLGKKIIWFGVIVIIILVSIFVLFDDNEVKKFDNNEKISEINRKKEVGVVDAVRKKVLELNNTVLDSKDKFKQTIKNIIRKSDEDKVFEEELHDKSCDGEEIFLSVSEKICFNEEDNDFAVSSDGTYNGRKGAVAQIAMDAKDYFDGGPDGYDDISVSDKVCKVLLAKNMYNKNGVGDLYNVFFCDAEGRVSGKLELTTLGIDSDNIEYISGNSYLPYLPSMTEDGLDKFKSMGQAQSDFEFNPKNELPKDITEVSENLKKNLYSNLRVVSSEILANSGTVVNPSNFYELSVEDESGNVEKYYTPLMTAQNFLTEDEFSDLKDTMNKMREFADKIPDSKFHEMYVNGELEPYLCKKVGCTQKEIDIFAEINDFYKQKELEYKSRNR